MPEMTPSTSSEATLGSNDAFITPRADVLGRIPIKRVRPQLSCTPCRQGKLKCNREHPICDQCSRRARHDACHYVPPPARNKQAQNMRGRLKNLESLVVNLINQKSQELEPTTMNETVFATSQQAQVVPAQTFGQLRISHAGTETKTNYVGAGHWSSLLKEIEEVKDSLEDDDDDGEEDPQEEQWDDYEARSTVTFGMPKPITKAQLIQEMPPKEEVDRLMPLWFNSADPLLYIIHAPTFQEEYRQFWKDPNSVSVMWIALLYSAMALAIILGPRNPDLIAYAGAHTNSNDRIDYPSASVNRYQQLASSALVLADIAKCQPNTVEALMIYGECEFLRRDDHHSKIWLMHGVVLRVAMRMGYHRDPNAFSSMPPFVGEMRRRVWHVLNMMDVLISFAIGLPSLVRRVESDVRAPRNLYDSDISPKMTKLPQARPLTEVTPGMYTIAKSRICVIFAEAAEHSQKVTPPKHSVIMELDKRLENAQTLIPDGMKVRPMEDCITEAPTLIMARFNIVLLYLKTRVVLHRNYLTAGQTNPMFSESRDICVKSALKILEYQKIIFHACEPGGQLHKVWWYMSSLQTYDYLLAAMVLCLELNHLRAINDTTSKAQKLLEVIETTHDIWSNYPNRFRETC
ncbi:hypothetical protein K504DRAFT_166951 [Pleomassaria siparia CBS 279.74]|uniref:Zn(2)-C6 fungal-type domain-containing protein n=1 Tax=Pleomassaria siparia CBS 279.74 TaxID=1314801 RepID=A0A6G1JUU5_9PLEO|nr:hypothetical protein K504DRAFT_166951 [Pleomassaria siparia CBS 279.74]